jgi:Right handed beta helix region
MLLPACMLLAALTPALARTVTVSCDETTISSVFKTLDPQASNTIKVIGACRDSIGIYNFANLTIVGVNTGSQKPTIKSLNGGPIFWIVGSHVQMSNLTLDGGVYGVMCREFSVCRFSGNTIQNATGNGVNLDSADATFTGDVIQNNANSGLNLTASRVRVTQVTLKGTTAGSWGPGNGVDVNSGSTLTVEQLTVQNNQGAGVSLVGNSHLTNRPWTGLFTVINNAAGGVWVTEQSSADLSGATVTNNAGANAGAGVVIDGNSEASFWGGGTFTDNQPMDLYCGALNGIAAAPQLATIGVTNCPNTY